MPPTCEIVPKNTPKLRSSETKIPKLRSTKKTTQANQAKKNRLCIEGLCVLDSLRSFFKQSTFEYEVSRKEHLIEYQRGHYKAYARFQKGNVNAYRIGKGLRPYLKQWPLFMDTFGIQGNSNNCQKGANLLVEHLPGKTLREIHTPHFYIYDALYVFYQIYVALAAIRFTHGSLTCDHVLVYELPGYLDYHYPDCSFQSKYLVKLVNYENSTLEGVKRCVDGANDLDLLKDYARVSRMKPHANKYIQGFVQVFEDARSIAEAERRFRELIQDPVRQRVNEKTQGTRLGTLYVYGDRAMEFLYQ